MPSSHQHEASPHDLSAGLKERLGFGGVSDALRAEERAPRTTSPSCSSPRANSSAAAPCGSRLPSVGGDDRLLAGPRPWDQGYATEAARALLGFGFEKFGLHRITSWATPESVGSWRVMEKAGMRREGHEREAAFFKGRWRDWLRYAMLDHEWEASP